MTDHLLISQRTLQVGEITTSMQNIIKAYFSELIDAGVEHNLSDYVIELEYGRDYNTLRSVHRKTGGVIENIAKIQQTERAIAITTKYISHENPNNSSFIFCLN